MDRRDEKLRRAADLLNAEQIDEAEVIARELLAANSRNINALRLLGAVTRKQGKLEESLEHFRKAVALNDRKGVLHFELGTAYTELQRSQEAHDCYLKAIELEPTIQPAYVNLSALMEQHQRYEEAIDWAEKAIALKPDCGLAHYNLANARRELGQLPAAVASYEQALRFKPERAKTLWNLGICHLLSGNYADGWRLFERREEAQEVFFDRYPEPRWDGSSLAGKTIVVHAEQGIGDEILFATCFPDILPLAKRCIFVCDPRLEKLFARSFPQAGVYGHLRRKDWSPPVLPEPFDLQIPAGSLPLLFRSSPESFPRRDKFLEVDPQLLAMWRERLTAAGPGLKVGISWRAGGKPLESRKRTIPLDQWSGIFAIPGTQFVNLQYGDASADIAKAKSRYGIEIHDWEEGDPLVNIDSFAAKIAALDLVISVGNATVHVAGAVGTPAWTLLPLVPSWRWMISGEESPWYGKVRLFRQTATDQWQPVLDRIAAMLANASTSSNAGNGSAEESRLSLSTARATRNAAANISRWFEPADLAGHKTDQLVAAALSDARRFEELGDFTQAETKYRAALQLAPRHYAALNGLGCVARKTGRTELAIRSFRRSLAMIDALPEQQFNLADALADAERWEESLTAYKRGLELEPSNVAARIQSARMLRRLARVDEAIDYYRQALAIVPEHEPLIAELGECLAAACRLDEAIAHLQQAVAERPLSPLLLAALGSAYLEDQRFEEAVERLEEALQADPSLTPASCKLAEALRALGRSGEAAECLQKAIAMDGRSFEAIALLASLSNEIGQFERSIELYQRALAIRPAEPQVLNSLGALLLRRGEIADALDCLDDAVHFAPPLAEAHVNRGFALLAAGRLTEAWQEYEWRWKCRETSRSQEVFRQPRWDGSTLSGKAILIHAEQGLAEELMFATCYAEVIEQAEACSIICDPRLEPLLRRSLPGANVFAVPRGREHQWRPPADLRVDVQISAGSLPRLLRQTWESFSQRRPPFAAEAIAVAARRMAIAKQGDGLTVGVGISPQEDGEFVVGTLTLLMRTLSQRRHMTLVPIGCDVSVSLKDSASESKIPLIAMPLLAPHDIDEMAARLAACDLVIAGGGLAGHLAGALGLPTCVLLSDYSDWRWFGPNKRLAWYPLVRILRPDRAGNAAESIQWLCAELLNFAGENDDQRGMKPIPRPHWIGPGTVERTH